jgi:hypothetical protein
MMEGVNIVTSHTNSQDEEIAIGFPPAGDFKGQELLILYDDPPARSAAPMLLDQGTIEWLHRYTTSHLMGPELTRAVVALTRLDDPPPEVYQVLGYLSRFMNIEAAKRVY